jgi:FtsP/CotA-like multicopper oxidase with cupredoxin domain
MVEKILFISGHNLVTLQKIAREAQSTLWDDAVSQSADAGLDTNVFLVNGQLKQNMTLDSHVWHRLRMVYSAVEQALAVTVDGDATCELQLLAKDGIYLHEIPRAITAIYLYPGARADVALSCTCTAYPCTADLKSQAQVQGQDVETVTLLTIFVTETAGGVVETLPTTTLDRPCYLADLRSATVPNGQSGTLFFHLPSMAVQWDGVGDSMNYAEVTAKGGMSDWPPLTTFVTGSVYEIEAAGVNAHPMHSHVNPFQIQDMNGETTLDGGYFQAGDWHDTLYLPSMGKGSVTLRMNTDAFTGKMVIHCHILDHEDQGMMGYILLNGTEGDVFADAKTLLDPSCYDTAFAGAAPTPAPPPTTAPPPTRRLHR